jgi:hypothetical protein
MAQFILIGICAGAAAALLFASISSGLPPAILLAQLAPLPILIAGLGWSHWAALLAAVTSALGLAAYFSGYLFLVSLLSVGLPAWWLSYLALLARPSRDGSGAVEWYPPGRLALWATVLGAAVTAIGLIKLGSADLGFEAMLKAGFERFLRLQSGTPDGEPLKLPGISDPDRFLEILVLVIPPAAAAFASVTNVLNLWLAGRVVNMSGRLPRPWPDLAELRYPAFAALVFVAALAGSALTDLPGALCRLLAASLLIAYVLVGFAVLHALTRYLQNRFFVLASAYAAVLVFQWPTLLVLLLGLTDPLLDLRARAAAKRGRPQLPMS